MQAACAWGQPVRGQAHTPRCRCFQSAVSGVGMVIGDHVACRNHTAATLQPSTDRAVGSISRACKHTTIPLQELPVEAMPRGVFRLRYFDVGQALCAMKVGTDGLLLGSWAVPPPDAQFILDIGTGSGLLALMAAQRAPMSAQVHAIDVDEAACTQAAANAASSPFAGTVQVYHAPLQDLVQAAQACTRCVAAPGPAARPVTPLTPFSMSFTMTASTAATSCSAGTGGQTSQQGMMSPQPAQPSSPPSVTCDGGQSGPVLPLSSWVPPPRGYDMIISNPPFFEKSSQPLPERSPSQQPSQPVTGAGGGVTLPTGAAEAGGAGGTDGSRDRTKGAAETTATSGIHDMRLDTSLSSLRGGSVRAKGTLHGTAPDQGQGPAASRTSTQAAMTATGSAVNDKHTANRSTSSTSEDSEAGGSDAEGDAAHDPRRSKKGLHVKGVRRALARHADACAQDLKGLSFEDLASGAAALLAPGGAFFVVLPTLNREADRFRGLAEAEGLQLVKVLHIYFKASDAQAKRRLFHFVKPLAQPSSTADTAGSTTSATGATAVQLQEERMTVRQAQWVDAKQAIDNVYTEQYAQLTEAFHHPGYYQRLLKGTAM